jgi:hypothetical protein
VKSWREGEDGQGLVVVDEDEVLGATAVASTLPGVGRRA